MNHRQSVAACDEEEFVTRYGPLFEHSPWIARAAWRQRPAHGYPSRAELLAGLAAVIRAAPHSAQLRLLRAHPPLAAGLARGGAALTRSSRDEQKAANLDACSPEELEEFERLNRDYLARHGFPFIMAVKGFRRREILDRFRQHLANETGEEFSRAIEEVIRIGANRLSEREPDR